jgi:hypothetical protein
MARTGATKLKKLIGNNDAAGEPGATVDQFLPDASYRLQITKADPKNLTILTLPVFCQMFTQCNDGDIPPFETPDLPYFQDRLARFVVHRIQCHISAEIRGLFAPELRFVSELTSRT